MPIISYPAKAHDKAIALAGDLANAEPHMVDWHTAKIGGFFSGLRCCLPSEAVGLLIMAHDDALEHLRNAKEDSS